MYPFKHVLVNHMETICLFLLILGLVVIIFGFHSESPQTISAIMAIIVLIPCLIILAGVVAIVYNYRRDKTNLESGDVDSKRAIKPRIDAMKSRLTNTQKDLFPSNSSGRSSSSYQQTHENSIGLDNDDEDNNIETQIETGMTVTDGEDDIELTSIQKHSSTEL